LFVGVLILVFMVTHTTLYVTIDLVLDQFLP